MEWTHYGDGPGRTELDQLVGSGPRHLTVAIKGHVPAQVVHRELRSGNYDVFINLSLSEGAPVSLMEAQCVGMPVVATAVGGTPEVAPARFNELVSPDDAVSTLAQAIRRAYARPAEEGAARRDHWARNYHADDVYPAWAQELLGVVRLPTDELVHRSPEVGRHPRTWILIRLPGRKMRIACGFRAAIRAGARSPIGEPLRIGRGDVEVHRPWSGSRARREMPGCSSAHCSRRQRERTSVGDTAPVATRAVGRRALNEPTAKPHDATPSRPLRVAMVLYGDITFDGRVQREANSLVGAGHSVTVFCSEGSHPAAPMLDPRVDLVVVRTGRRPESPDASSLAATRNGIRRNAARLAFLAAYARSLRTWAHAISRTSTAFDVWHAHDFTGLVAAGRARPADAALVYDMHDLFLESGAGARLPAPLRWLLSWYERRLVRNAVLLVTVNQSLAAYALDHQRPRSVAVVHNCVPAWPMPDPRPNMIRDALGLAPAEPVVLYHGLLGGDRGLDTLIQAMLEPGLERAHLVLMGFGPDRDRLRDLARESRFREPSSCHRCRLARGSPALGGVRRRRRDAEPAAHAE